MIATNTAPAAPPIPERQVTILQTDPQGQQSTCCLLTVLNRLSAIGYDRWTVRAELAAGVEITTANGWLFRAQSDHQGREWQVSPSYAARAPVTISADDVKEAYVTLVHALERPRHRALLEALLAAAVSKVKNHAQVLTLRAGAWDDEYLKTVNLEDAKRASHYAALSAALSWVGDELIVLLGRAIKTRASEIRPFDFPEAWQADPPTDAELEEQFIAQGGEQREEVGRE